jgi:hypothetical protein
MGNHHVSIFWALALGGHRYLGTKKGLRDCWSGLLSLDQIQDTASDTRNNSTLYPLSLFCSKDGSCVLSMHVGGAKRYHNGSLRRLVVDCVMAFVPSP